jgi:hypothetical protein
MYGDYQEIRAEGISFSEIWTCIPLTVLPGKSRVTASLDWPIKARVIRTKSLNLCSFGNIIFVVR